jgi:hypothetical protein
MKTTNSNFMLSKNDKIKFNRDGFIILRNFLSNDFI